MKRWIKWGVTTVLASTIVSLSPWTNRVLALTQPEIIQKLQTVPVFILADADGNMVPLSIFEGDVQDNQSFLGIFISQSDALSALATLQSESTEANQLNAIPLPLADAYNMIINSQDLENIPPFAFIPQQEQLDLAAQVLTDQGADVVLTPLTVPLFHLSSTADNSYITISRGESDRESIPLFFDGNEAQFLLDLLNEQATANNEPAPTIELEVAFLHQWLQVFESNNEDALQLVELIPIPESQALIANLINQLRQQQGQPLPTQPSESFPAQPPEASPAQPPEASPAQPSLEQPSEPAPEQPASAPLQPTEEPPAPSAESVEETEAIPEPSNEASSLEAPTEPTPETESAPSETDNMEPDTTESAE